MSATPFGPSQGSSNGSQLLSQKREHFTSPHIRATAHAVCSADMSNYPKFCEVVSDLASAARDARQAERIVEELRRITTDIRDGVPLSPQEFILFLREYVTCRELLLPMVSHIERVSGTPLGQTLALTSQLDQLCTESGVLSIQIFPILKKIHCFFMQMIPLEAECDFLMQVNRDQILHTLMRFLCKLLEKGLVAMRAYQRHVGPLRVDSNKPEGTSKVVATNGSANIDGEKPKMTPESRGQMQLEKGCTIVETVILEPDVKAVFQEIISEALACKPLFDVMPYDLADTFCDIHADLQVHFAHICWYLKATSRSSSEDSLTQANDAFDGGMAKLSDLSVLRMWSAAVGVQPACEAQLFKETLLPKLGPEWLWDPLMEVLNYKNCGVVSFFSLNRLLKVWGPLVVMEENFGQGIQRGSLCLTKPFEYWRWMFARRPDAAAGDYLVALTETPGEVYVIVLNRPQSAKGAAHGVRHGSSPFSRPPSITNAEKAELPGAASDLRLASYPLSQETGLWVIVGMARKMFDSIVEACDAFPILFCRPCGERYVELSVGGDPGSSRSIGGGRRSTPFHPSTGSMEGLALHHACYYGNARYVQMLLLHGAATIVNCAVVDLIVSPGFCWTPLLCAVNTPNSDPVEVVRMLLDAGADPNCKDDAECTALYYAIANGYAGSVALLLERCPTLSSSPVTIPLFMALGANWFLPRSSDIRRLADLIPLASVVAAVLTTVHEYDLVYLAVRILQRIMFAPREVHEGAKGIEEFQETETSVANISEPYSSSDWGSPDAQLVLKYLPMGHEALEIHTDDEISSLTQIIRSHDLLCRAQPLQMQMVLRALYDRCFLLSVRNTFSESRDVPNAHTSSNAQ
ncbi:unnamed protein product [Phytomonas sp. EM1]|nr:unnamed protein product [Phytomonas sp. EM1]|eukprot:CCW59577.1 unnamed protein product [Phytomonas sp. isolate EM1]